MNDATMNTAEVTLPIDRRPLAFAGTELIMDLLYVARERFNGDCEALLMHLCALRATKERGAISRSDLCRCTGLARETVRRKAAQLIASGDLIEAGRGRLVAALKEDGPHAQAFAHEARRAAQRYVDRAAQAGISIGPTKPTQT